MSSRLSLGVVLVLALTVPAFGYNVVDTSSSVNCLFSTNCTVFPTDYMHNFTVTGGAGQARLQSRYYQGQPGSVAAGKWIYRYRVTLENVVATGSVLPYVDAIGAVNYGLLRQYDYNFDTVATDHVFNVTVGGAGSKGVTSSFAIFGWTYFFYDDPVYAGTLFGPGQSSYFMGVVSDHPPVLREMRVRTNNGWLTVWGYAPDLP